MVKPLNPREVQSLNQRFRTERIPDEVIEIFNEMIVKEWNGRDATIRQDDIVAAVVEKLGLESDRPVFDNHWLDVEELFRKEGWKVEYDRPAYCETFPATFKFSFWDKDDDATRH